MDYMDEESKVMSAQQTFKDFKAFRRIPYVLINAEAGAMASDIKKEMAEICAYYRVYRKGTNFPIEGTNGDYVAANLRYKMVATLIGKEARFLFAEAPDMKVEYRGDIENASNGASEQLSIWNDMLDMVLDGNRFEKILLQACKDCFVGKRVACLINFNEDDGITISFLPSTQFLYETKIGNANVITKFVCFQVVRDGSDMSNKRIFKKKYTLEDDTVYLEERMYDGSGIEVGADEFEPTEKQAIQMSIIPAVIFLNDGLTGDDKGESEVESLMDYERWYSKLSNADMDAERKSMNPTRYTIDMDGRSTQKLSTGAGSYWDLQSDQNLDKPAPAVGMLESSMGYSDSLKTTLDRIKTTGYEQIDMPNITLETMVGAITSGKALKAVYWPLIVRCKEKMKMWGPQLASIIDIIFIGALAYPNCITKYVEKPLIPILYKPVVVQNTPLPEDEAEEKSVDLAEVAANTMSRKAYMQKWRNLTDKEVDAELMQMAREREMLEDSIMPPVDNSFGSSTESGTMV